MSLTAPSGISLRPYLPSDASQLCDLIKDSIYELASEDYNANQCAAWAESATNKQEFIKKLEKAVTLLAIYEDETCGFISLKDNIQIDMLYTSPRFAGKGIATFLCGAVELLAMGRKSSKLTINASDTAISLFTHLKYKPVRRNTVTINGEWLANTTMEKDLNPADTQTATQ